MTRFSDDHLNRLRQRLNDDTTQAGKYLIGQEIGQGGMATVYEAEDIDLGRKVALKALKEGEASHELAGRMLREARIVARLEHASIVPIHDVGTLPDGRAFYTMKLVQGRTLAEIVEDRLPLRELLGMFQRVCDALAFAHSRGVIHRDLKPTNIMIGEFGQILVMDWGIAKALSKTDRERQAFDPDTTLTSLGKKEQPGPDPEATIEGTVLGTPAYMSPEQARGEVGLVNRGSDIYSLGAVLYFILTSRAPYEGDSRAIVKKVIDGIVTPPRDISRSVPRPLEAICLKAMAPVPDDRYATVLELSEDIRRFLEREPVTAYRENLIERTGRFIVGNKLIVAMVLVYILARVIIYIVSRL